MTQRNTENNKMQALKFHGPWKASIVHTPELYCEEADDIVVNVQFCGICGTDIGILTGDYAVARPGVTLGHEASGVIESIGPAVCDFSVGDRVVINPTYACRQCRPCHIGNENHCSQKDGTEAGVSYDGAFATRYRAKGQFLRKLDDHVTFQEATLTEPLSCTLTGVDKLNIKNNAIRAVIIGAGPMGALYAWSLNYIGVSVVVIENNAHRLDYAKNILPGSARIFTDFGEAMAKLYADDDREVDVVVDTSGAMTEIALLYLSAGGKLLTVALKEIRATISTMHIADKSLSIIGSIDSLNNSFERAYCAIRDKHIPVDRMISHTFPMTAYKSAFSLLGCDLGEAKSTPMTEPNCKVLLKIA